MCANGGRSSRLERNARDCTGEDRCLAAIGKRLGVDVILAGTVGQLGDNYVLNIKAVEVASGDVQLHCGFVRPDDVHGVAGELVGDDVGHRLSFWVRCAGRRPACARSAH